MESKDTASIYPLVSHDFSWKNRYQAFEKCYILQHILKVLKTHTLRVKSMGSRRSVSKTGFRRPSWKRSLDVVAKISVRPKGGSNLSPKSESTPFSAQVRENCTYVQYNFRFLDGKTRVKWMGRISSAVDICAMCAQNSERIPARTALSAQYAMIR